MKLRRVPRILVLLATAALVGATASAQTLTMAMAAQPDTLDPQLTSATAAFQVAKSIYDGLVEVDQSGRIVPALAKSYSVSNDGLAYTFELNDATFHDGTAFDAADVVATLDRIRAEATASPKRSEFANITEVTAVDDHTVTISLSQPTPALLASLASGWGAMLPSEKVAAGHDFGVAPIGTGPFVFKSWVRDNAITLTRNASYYGGAPAIEQVVIRFISDSAVQYQGLVTGEFDIIDTVPQTEQANVQSNPALSLVQEPSGTVLVAGINARQPYLNDARVRRALNMAVDTEIVLDVAYGGGTQGGTFMEAGSPWYPEEVQPFPYDPEKAKAILKDAGVPDGWTIRLVLPQPYPAHIQAGQIVQDYLREIGINAEISIVEWGVWLSEVYGGPHEYDITVVGHTGKLDPSGRLTGLGTDRYYTGVIDDELADWIATANVTADPVKRQSLYTQALIRLHDDAPFIFFGTANRIYAKKASVTGFWMTPLLDSFDFRAARFE